MKFRTVALILAALLLTAALPVSALWVREPAGLPGDADGDGKITSTDARMALQFSVGKLTADRLDTALADVDGDEDVTSTDARLILQRAVDKIDAFPGAGPMTVTRSEAETTPNENPETFADYRAGNPIFNSIFTADPSAHVWEDGRLYVYASHDIFPSRGCDLMDKYHVFSTDNMVDWVDHGQILSADDNEWGRSEGGFMWAPDCAYKDGVYYFYYPHPCDSDWNNSWRIGVATSDKPAEDFTDRGMMKNPDGTPVGSGTDPVTGKSFNSFIDPCVFEDTDGTFYMTVGGGGRCYIARLADDMMTLAEDLIPIPELKDFHEGSWLFKENGLYYLVYADGGNEGGDRMQYAVADNPYGPYRNMGVIIDPVLDCSTSHGSVVQYKGNWYLFYHNSRISGNGTLRSVCVDRLYFDEAGRIRKVVQTAEGVEAVGPAATEGNIEPKYSESGIQGVERYTVSTRYEVGDSRISLVNCNYNGGHTCIENMHNGGSSITITGVNGGKGGKALLTVEYGSADNASSKVDTDLAEGYYLRLKKTGGWGDYSGVARVVIDLKAGENVIVLGGGMGGFNPVAFTVSLLPENAG